jgi:SAM-dependent methyltransferase
VAEIDGLRRRFSYSWLAHAIRQEGMLSTMQAALPFLGKAIRLWWWDATHHVSTRTRVFKRNLGVTGPGAPHARPYEACDTTVLPHVLPRLNIQYSDYAFVDLGAGKGQAVFLAAEFPFKRAIGVELSPMLHAIARRNCYTFSSRRQACTQIEMICGDAADFAFPNDPLVVYIFNSFDDVVLSQVLANLIVSVHKHPRDVVLIYHNAQHRYVVEATGAFVHILTGTDDRDFRKLGFDVFRHRH